MTNKDLTEIIFVVDRSGSMESIRDDTIGGYNTFLGEQKKVDKPCKVTYTQFDDQYEVVHNGIDIKDVPPLTAETFVPRGWTALHDAIGRTINEVGARLSVTPEHERPGKVLFVVMTDGHENSSHEFNAAQIKEMITHQQEKYQWEFIFLAANQDAVVGGTELGVKRNFNFAAKGAAVMDMHKKMSSTVSRYRRASNIVECNAALDGMSDTPDLGQVVTSTTTTGDTNG